MGSNFDTGIAQFAITVETFRPTGAACAIVYKARFQKIMANVLTTGNRILRSVRRRQLHATGFMCAGARRARDTAALIKLNAVLAHVVSV